MLHRASAVIEVDGKRFFRGRVSAVLAGNVGKILGGLEVFRGAEPDSGLLELGVVTARNPADWARVFGRIVAGQPAKSKFVRITSGKRIKIRFDRPFPYELDGGDRKPVRKLKIRVHPASITVCVPPSVPAPQSSGPADPALRPRRGVRPAARGAAAPGARLTARRTVGTVLVGPDQQYRRGQPEPAEDQAAHDVGGVMLAPVHPRQRDEHGHGHRGDQEQPPPPAPGVADDQDRQPDVQAAGSRLVPGRKADVGSPWSSWLTPRQGRLTTAAAVRTRPVRGHQHDDE
jgi:hypothetical protein